jgi:hypothetical protein
MPGLAGQPQITWGHEQGNGVSLPSGFPMIGNVSGPAHRRRIRVPRQQPKWINQRDRIAANIGILIRLRCSYPGSSAICHHQRQARYKNNSAHEDSVRGERIGNPSGKRREPWEPSHTRQIGHPENRTLKTT